MPAEQVENKTAMRAELEEQVEAFLARGGQIESVPRGVSGTDGTRGKHIILDFSEMGIKRSQKLAEAKRKAE